jgi:hypothetical protein
MGQVHGPVPQPGIGAGVDFGVALTSKGPLPYKPRDFERGNLDNFGGFGREAKPCRRAADPTSRCSGQRRTTREADLSTEQAGAQAPSRFSCPHGDDGRPQGRGRAPRARPQAAQRLMLDAIRPIPWSG